MLGRGPASDHRVRVGQQMLNILRLVNDARRRAALQPIGSEVLRYRRRIVKAFDWPDDRVAA